MVPDPRDDREVVRGITPADRLITGQERLPDREFCVASTGPDQDVIDVAVDLFRRLEWRLGHDGAEGDRARVAAAIGPGVNHDLQQRRELRLIDGGVQVSDEHDRQVTVEARVAGQGRQCLTLRDLVRGIGGLPFGCRR